MRLLFIIVIFASCTSIHQTDKISMGSIWNIIENASFQQWTSEKLMTMLGKPSLILKNPTKDIHLAWVYKNSKTGFQEWGISFKKDNTVYSVTYLPQDLYRHEFTVDKIVDRWTKMNCVRKEKQEVFSDFIRTVRYVECNRGTHIISYNKYNEVESILVMDKKKP